MLSDDSKEFAQSRCLRPAGSWHAPGAWQRARVPRWQPACAAPSAHSGKCGWLPRCWSPQEGCPARERLPQSAPRHRIASGSRNDQSPSHNVRPHDPDQRWQPQPNPCTLQLTCLASMIHTLVVHAQEDNQDTWHASTHWGVTPHCRGTCLDLTSTGRVSSCQTIAAQDICGPCACSQAHAVAKLEVPEQTCP